MIIGTAGHIDHGKTALVRALTGVETDRLPEEKARGITIDLGYAYQPLAGGETLGFVDVPGHERLVHTMIAGATGIDFVLLVVAADDGPMPQTREHLQVLDLLGLRHGAVALTKIDRVAPERIAQVSAEIRQLLAPTALADSPLFPVCALTGAGVGELRRYLEQAAQDQSPPANGGGFRLAVDRCFTLTGIGTVVTGTAHSGAVQTGDRLLLSPSGREVRVRAIHAQNQPVERGVAGQRCALNLTGPEVERQAIHRGDWVIDPALHFPTARLDVELRVLATEAQALRHWLPVHVHLGATDLTGRLAVLAGDAIAPGEMGLAQLVLDQPLAALHGDRLIVRDQPAQRTLGGGRVLDVAPPTRGRRKPQRLALLRAFCQTEPLEAMQAALAVSEAGIDLGLLGRHWNLQPASLAALTTLPDTVAVSGANGIMLFSRTHWQLWRARLLAALAAEHSQFPGRLGPDRERLRRIAAPTLNRPIFAALLDELTAQGQVVRTGPWVHLPEHQVRLAPDDQARWQADLAPLLRAVPFNPPRVRDLAQRLGWEEATVRRLLKQLAGMGEVFQVAQDHFFTREAVAELSALAFALAEQEGAARAASFRDRIGGGRKVAIHILEFFDRLGYSHRIGDEHRIFRDTLLGLNDSKP
ncbi:selenocysteinyl-tRNA-specific translation factor [Candidatus Competibacter denitrificans Run_A_D11]|uniref:Selenocysteine-specific elongation factor n=1 Tax=Candidatus Competibacter denitrificans Run_A_D11 TaxID=1400863 RepID=W6MDL7_9GAMM|nr:selenocysteine-specific translation elongation factor [Candidatus Competibacter denitrificans]CDI03083.1 selenocysteinyl-tRNA-specific translation factor [Candidatus Competibacter denitrificans Run_A_D11]HCK81232.1 selenocysteine-specific translation elongation factor [Candidatus Competibacteraceae bacterium]HRC68753.1 selenocysteine-specific translation elongation factor [Candidatus Competibacter denitrificans]